MDEQCVEDVNECELNTHECGDSSICYNTLGSYKCLCDSGHFNYQGKCYPVDTCLQSIIIDEKSCGEKESCVQGENGFKCKCDDGFIFDGQKCVGMNKCETDSPCGENETCESTEGSFTCSCKVGYDCSTDPCGTGQNNCDEKASCTNTDGGFSCTCLEGLFGVDGTKCEDIDECRDSIHDCTPTQQCVNTLGSYKCVKGKRLKSRMNRHRNPQNFFPNTIILLPLNAEQP